MEKQQAIYSIRNKVNHFQYVGGTSDFRHRKISHLSLLRNNKGWIEKLQNDFNLFGEKSFEFVILEPLENIDQKQIFEREQKWIDFLRPEYNLNPIAGNNICEKAHSIESIEKTRHALTGRKQPPELVAKRIATMIKNGKQHLKRLTTEQKQHLSEINTGERNPNWGLKRSEETKRKLGEARAGNYVGAVSPTGEIFSPIHNMSKFCVENGLCVSNMVALMHGRVKICKGWTRFEPKPEAAGGVNI